MSEHVDNLIRELSEYLTAAEGTSEADAAALILATERIALLIGDNGLKPGDAIMLSTGAVYHVEPAYFFENDSLNVGQLLCRNWKALETTEAVMADAAAHKILDGVALPNVWEEEPRESADLAERIAFLKELPELAARLRIAALKKRNPEIGRAAKLAQKLADVIETEVNPPSIEG